MTCAHPSPYVEKRTIFRPFTIVKTAQPYEAPIIGEIFDPRILAPDDVCSCPRLLR